MCGTDHFDAGISYHLAFRLDLSYKPQPLVLLAEGHILLDRNELSGLISVEGLSRPEFCKIWMRVVFHKIRYVGLLHPTKDQSICVNPNRVLYVNLDHVSWLATRSLSPKPSRKAGALENGALRIECPEATRKCWSMSPGLSPQIPRDASNELPWWRPCRQAAFPVGANRGGFGQGGDNLRSALAGRALGNVDGTHGRGVWPGRDDGGRVGELVTAVASGSSSLLGTILSRSRALGRGCRGIVSD